jgi:hypothetical protein
LAFAGGRRFVFLGGGGLARFRIAAIMAKASITSVAATTCRLLTKFALFLTYDVSATSERKSESPSP